MSTALTLWWLPQVLHLEIDLSGSGMACHPGDAIGIKAENDPTLVDKLLALLAADGSQVFSVAGADGEPGKLSHLGWPCTLRHAFAAGCDITGVPKKSLLRMLAEYCSDAAEKNRLLYLSSRYDMITWPDCICVRGYQQS